MEENKVSHVSRGIQRYVSENIVSHIENRNTSFTRDEIIELAAKTKVPFIYDEIEPNDATLRDIGARIFALLLQNGMIIPVKGTKYFRKITQDEMRAAKRTYLKLQEELSNAEEAKLD